MYLLWSLWYLVFITCTSGESYRRQHRSLLCQDDIFRALINSLVCWRQGGEIFIFVLRRRNISFTNQERETFFLMPQEDCIFPCSWRKQNNFVLNKQNNFLLKKNTSLASQEEGMLLWCSKIKYFLTLNSTVFTSSWRGNISGAPQEEEVFYLCAKRKKPNLLFRGEGFLSNPWISLAPVLFSITRRRNISLALQETSRNLSLAHQEAVTFLFLFF